MRPPLAAALVAALALARCRPARAEDARLESLLEEVRVWQSRGRELEAMVLELRQADASAQVDDVPSQPLPPALHSGEGLQALVSDRLDEFAAADSTPATDGGSALSEDHAVSITADARVLSEEGATRESEQFAGGKDRNFVDRPCSADKVGYLLCETEKGFHRVILTVFVKKVTLFCAAATCTLLNMFGYRFRWVCENVMPVKGFLSAVVVLNLFHTPFVTFSPAILSYVFILLQVFLAEQSKIYFADKLQWMKEKWIDVPPLHDDGKKHKTGFQPENMPKENTPGDRVVTSRYRELTLSFNRVAMYFFAQGTLMLFYTYEVMLPEQADSHVEMSCMRWILAVVLCYIAGEEELGGRYGAGYYDLIIAVARGDGEKADSRFRDFTRMPQSHHFPKCLGVTFVTEWRIRKGLGLFVNGVFRSLILGTAPVLLASSGPLSFIQDCLALFFITRLDDIDDAKSLRQELRHVLADRASWAGEDTTKYHGQTTGELSGSLLAGGEVQ